LQKCISQSATKAKYVAAAEAAMEAIWLNKLIAKIGFQHGNGTPRRIEVGKALRCDEISKAPRRVEDKVSMPDGGQQVSTLRGQQQVFTPCGEQASVQMESSKSSRHVELNLYCDSQNAIHLATNQIMDSRIKHIDIRYHFLRHAIAEKIFELVKIDGKLNPADAFTKMIPLESFQRHCTKLQILHRGTRRQLF
jgi:hypothetical protein